MSIAANAPWFLLKLRRSGMFIRRFMESFNVRGTTLLFSISFTGGEEAAGIWSFEFGASPAGSWKVGLSRGKAFRRLPTHRESSREPSLVQSQYDLQHFILVHWFHYVIQSAKFLCHLDIDRQSRS